MNDWQQRDEIAELRQWVDWLAWRIGELERQAPAQTAQPVAPAAPAADEFRPVPDYRPQPTPQPAPATDYATPAEPAYASVMTNEPVAAQAPIQSPMQAPTQPFVQPPYQPPPARGQLSLEDLLSPERLAWAGGALLVLGIGFLVSWGIHKGWITPTMRIVGAAIVSAGIGAGALFLRERGDIGAGPKAMAAVSVAGMYATLTAACQLYDMIPSKPIALAIAALVAASGALFALRWDSELLAALALLGALLAAPLVKAPYNADTLAFTLVAYAATMTLSATRGWRFVVMGAVLIEYSIAYDCISSVQTAALTVIAWSTYWAVTQIGAFAFGAAKGRRAELAITLLAANGVIAAGGAHQLNWFSGAIANDWLVALAVAHALLALPARFTRAGDAERASATAPDGAAGDTELRKTRLRRIPAIDWILAITFSAIAAARILDGPAVVVTWCAIAGMVAWFTDPGVSWTTRALARVETAVLIGLSVIHVLSVEAAGIMDHGFTNPMPPIDQTRATVAIAAILAACAIWFWRDRSETGAMNETQMAPFAILATGTAFLAAILLEGSALVCAFAGLGAAAMILTPKSSASWSAQLARLGGASMLMLAAAHVIEVDAPIEMLSAPIGAISTTTLLNIFLAIGAIMAAAVVWLWRVPSKPDKEMETALPPFALIASGAAYIAMLWLDGAAEVCALAGLSVVSLFATPARYGPLGRAGSLALLSIAVGHAVGYEAKPIYALREGVPDIVSATFAFTFIAAAAAAHARGASRDGRTAAWGTSALALIYLSSAAIIYALPPGAGQTPDGISIQQIGSAQTGQALLSAFWALVAFAAVLVGLRLRIRELRIAGLSLLVVAVSKILIFDLATLDVAYRTISFIVVGAVLLAAAFAFQRLKRDDSATNAER